MFRFCKNPTIAALLGVLVVPVLATSASAQCSRGGGATGSAGGMTVFSMSQNPAATFGFAGQSQRAYPNPVQFAMQQQRYGQNQLRMAMQQQVARQRSQQNSASQTERLAMRRERAERTRERRAERIAAAKAERENARRISPNDTLREMYVTTRQPTDLTSLAAQINPFDP